MAKKTCNLVADDANLLLFREALLSEGRFPSFPWYEVGCVNLTDRCMHVQLWARKPLEGMRQKVRGRWVCDGEVDPDSAELNLSMPNLEALYERERLAVPSLLQLPAVDGPGDCGPSWIGDGLTLIDAAFEPVDIRGSLFARRYVWLLHQLHGLKWCYPYSTAECDVLFFRWSGGRGVLASMESRES